MRGSLSEAQGNYCQIHGNLVDRFFGFSNFQRLVNGCINADFCVQGVIFQRFSSFTFFPLHRSDLLKKANLSGFVLGCIDADFCVQGRIFQRFSSSTFFPLHHSGFL